MKPASPEINALAKTLACDPITALAALMVRSSPEPSIRVAATALFAFSAWQKMGRQLTPVPPSLLLINAGGASPDPLDTFAAGHFFPELKALDELRAAALHPDFHRNGMELAHKAASHVASVPQKFEFHAQMIDENARIFEEHRQGQYGMGPAGHYADLWHEKHGWLSGHDNHLVLRVQDKSDYRALLTDLLTRPERLFHPVGIGRSMEMETKSLCLSGTLDAAEWTEPVVSRLLELGWPVVFLPHSAASSPEVIDPAGLFLAFNRIGGMYGARLFPQPIAPDYRPATQDDTDDASNGLLFYSENMRRRLQHMPAEYDLQIRLLARAMDRASLLIAAQAVGNLAEQDAITILQSDLCGNLLRTLAIGVAALAWHGWGFRCEWPRHKVVALLEHLRQHGPTKFRDLQRRFHISADTCRALLAQLEKEDLVVCNGQHTEAVPLDRFAMALQQRDEFMPVSDNSALLLDPSPENLQRMRKNLRSVHRKNQLAQRKASSEAAKWAAAYGLESPA